LQEAAVNGFFMFGTFSIFWSTLIFYIARPVYRWGTREAGLLAIFGLFGALAAPLIGRLADRFSDRHLVLIGLLLETLAFLLLMAGGQFVVLLVLSIILLDVGNQFGQVSNQTRVQNLGEHISNRTNTVFMFSYFLDGSLGSLLGTTMWQQAGWLGVTAAGLVFQLLAYIAHLLIFRPKKAL
jgi:predicted MFS family arabinose efflux permease